MFQFSKKVTDVSVKTYRNRRKRKASQELKEKPGDFDSAHFPEA